MPTILITGTNRGIGLGLCEHYVKAGWRVLATTRQGGAHPVKGVESFALDLMDFDSIQNLQKTLQGEVIDVVWNNAGVLLSRVGGPAEIDNTQDWLNVFHVNTVAPLQLAKALRENVLASSYKSFIFTSSQTGSLEKNPVSYYSYCSSKAALNMSVSIFAKELEGDAKAVLVHPGHVQTDMGGGEAVYSVNESVTFMTNIVTKVCLEKASEHNGKFYNYDGSILPW